MPAGDAPEAGRGYSRLTSCLVTRAFGVPLAEVAAGDDPRSRRAMTVWTGVQATRPRSRARQRDGCRASPSVSGSVAGHGGGLWSRGWARCGACRTRRASTSSSSTRTTASPVLVYFYSSATLYLYLSFIQSIQDHQHSYYVNVYKAHPGRRSHSRSSRPRCLVVLVHSQWRHRCQCF